MQSEASDFCLPVLIYHKVGGKKIRPGDKVKFERYELEVTGA